LNSDLMYVKTTVFEICLIYIYIYILLVPRLDLVAPL